MLFDEIRRTLQGRIANVGQCNIMVHVFANFEDLSRKLFHVGILKSPGQLHDFARAFSLNQPLFSFVDVGRGKERADFKLKGTSLWSSPFAAIHRSLRMMLQMSGWRPLVFSG